MSYDRLKEVADKVVARQESVRGKGEQATRQAMILPFLEALGYDIWDTSEVCPEYEADTAIKKAGQKEKVDYALLLSGVPRIFIEVKPLGEILAPHAGQLARYFNSTTTVCLAIITDASSTSSLQTRGSPTFKMPSPSSSRASMVLILVSTSWPTSQSRASTQPSCATLRRI
ncbi:MAG: hypothetical protein HQ461_08025 [Deltaproteobacteria bacterium]|nr:hypothetical protein [Deltaproteobacteria bacterium]